VLAQLPFTVSVDGIPEAAETVRLEVNGVSHPLSVTNGTTTVEDIRVETGAVTVQLYSGRQLVRTDSTRAIPGWLSVLPPLLAIAMALVFRQVISSLFAGVWIGAWIAVEISWEGLFLGLLQTVDTYLVEALANPDHAAIIIFSLMIGGMVGVVSRSGGMQGVVNAVTEWASDARRGQLVTAFLGLGIFFDDYANTLIVGNTMRPLTDRLKVSREKLAYVVDSTAAPIACVALVSTWIGYEVGLIASAVQQIDGLSEGAYSIFLHSIPYSFYPLFALFFVFAVIGTQRDFGAMYEAERRAWETGAVSAGDASSTADISEHEELAPKLDRPHRAINAVVPVVVLIGSVLIGLYATGEGERLQEIIGSADAYRALLWGSLLGAFAAIGMVVSQRILTLTEAVDAWYTGVKTMLLAIVILLLAWALSAVTEVLHTADYLVSVLGPWIIPALLPAVVAVLSALTAFATGSSWGTMGIIMPLVLPLVWSVMELHELTTDLENYHILYSTVAVVLGGAVWGDHCSPISDTTILSSMAAGCDHIDHVRTQLPYAMTVGIISLLVGTVPAGFGIPWWICFPVGMMILLAVLLGFGQSVKTSQGPVSRERRKAPDAGN
jgi:Na+/H+ antiporter NhaC